MIKPLTILILMDISIAYIPMFIISNSIQDISCLSTDTCNGTLERNYQ